MERETKLVWTQCRVIIPLNVWFSFVGVLLFLFAISLTNSCLVSSLSNVIWVAIFCVDRTRRVIAVVSLANVTYNPHRTFIQITNQMRFLTELIEQIIMSPLRMRLKEVEITNWFFFVSFYIWPLKTMGWINDRNALIEQLFLK